ncbi:MAG TPA: hypothetical protein VD908_19445 [Cytophagales bacterium]|nr:hypothetical protein [Cytophagales bacterium]
MPYSYKNKKGVTYYLHQREGTGNKGQGRLFFFSRETGRETLDQVPDGYKVVENERNGLPILKKKD